jgi:hypothetical protein
MSTIAHHQSAAEIPECPGAAFADGACGRGSPTVWSDNLLALARKQRSTSEDLQHERVELIGPGIQGSDRSGCLGLLGSSASSGTRAGTCHEASQGFDTESTSPIQQCGVDPRAGPSQP